MKKETSAQSLARRARKIRLLILDVDGVMTDGGIILGNDGSEYKSFHVRDGHGIRMLIKAGVTVAIVTGRRSEVVERRASELGIKDVFQKCFDKLAAYSAMKNKYSLSDPEIAYMGDDIVDAPVMVRAGLPITVADADKEIKKHALMVTKKEGGRGAVREITDFLLKAKGLWKGMVKEYFEA